MGEIVPKLKRPLLLTTCGGGLVGLMAAAVAASLKQRVTVLTYDSGSLPLASGTLDFGSLENLPASHPYKKIGTENLDAAAKFLIDIAAQANLPYVGGLGKKIPAVTAVGTLKFRAGARIDGRRAPCRQ